MPGALGLAELLDTATGLSHLTDRIAQLPRDLDRLGPRVVIQQCPLVCRLRDPLMLVLSGDLHERAADLAEQGHGHETTVDARLAGATVGSDDPPDHELCGLYVLCLLRIEDAVLLQAAAHRMVGRQQETAFHACEGRSAPNYRPIRPAPEEETDGGDE